MGSRQGGFYAASVTRRNKKMLRSAGDIRIVGGAPRGGGFTPRRRHEARKTGVIKILRKTVDASNPTAQNSPVFRLKVIHLGQ
ncbi:hypothetical protein [Burkholderia gladioli]|uniref:hypothetical protein n=1 Tax=Burkholderia gladioli TaxID=28095 RepID=UPI000A57FE29|nr:hypothetical protein [Burkholderia gladioli]